MFQIRESRTAGKAAASKYLVDIFNWKYGYPTRQAGLRKIKPKGVPTSEAMKSSFRHRAAHLFNLLPEGIAKSSSLKSFKSKVKVWITENISLRA